MDHSPTCNTCQQNTARVTTTPAPRRLGQTSQRTTEIRVCDNPSCRVNTGPRRLGDTV